MSLIITRDEWGANPTSLPRRSMTLPATELWIHHTVTEVSADAARDMRVIERVGLERFGIFSYSYCIHPEGHILEGAGLRRGAHTARRNSTSFGVAWIGNYETRIPKIMQIEATRWLIWWLQEEGHLRPEIYPTGGHRDLKATACPGRHLHRILDELRQPWFPPEEKGEWPVLNHPPKVIVTRPQGDGYWIVAWDGGVFNFGNAPFVGSLADTEALERIISASAWPDGEGLLLMGEDGGVFALGSAQFMGRVEFRG